MADILAIGAHPDDVEISAGGTLVKMRKAGYSIALCAATDGEPTPHGSREIRLEETAAVAARLDCEYEILDMPNRYLVDSVENRIKIANVIRKHRPQVILCPHTAGFHPDHKAVSHMVDAARFYAKLTKNDPKGNPWPHDPWWAPRQYYYFLGGVEEGVMPTFIVDVTDEYDEKVDILNCYASQWQVDMKILSSSAHWGRLIGVEWGEAFVSRGPVGVDDLMRFIEKRGMPRKTPGKRRAGD